MQGTLQSLLQQYNLEASIWRSVFFMVQLTSIHEYWKNHQFSLVAQLCPTLCNPMNCSTPGLPVHHQLPEFTQTHVHRVGDAIQPSHPLLSLSPPAPNPSSIYTFLVTLNLKVLMEGREECVFWKNFLLLVLTHTFPASP